MHLQIATMEPEESLRALERGDADVIIAYSYEFVPFPLPTAVERRDFLADPVVVAVSCDDPLYESAGPIDLTVLSDRDWLVPHPASSCHQMIVRACGIAGFVPRATAYCADFPAMLALVGAGAGVALVPQLAAYHIPEGVVLRPITPVTIRHIFALTRPGGDRQPAARVVLDHLNAASTARSGESAVSGISDLT
jgi:DNA-binding transcriptional LysR family regulator